MTNGEMDGFWGLCNRLLDKRGYVNYFVADMLYKSI
ncbi:MAG: hypothetical protein RL732_953 [Bacteroidota bacterium]